MAGVPGAAGVEPRPLGADGEIGTYGACGTVFGVDGLKVGGGGGGTGLTVCARAWPMAKAAIIAASATTAKSAAAGRSTLVAAMPISSSFVGRPHALPHHQDIRQSSHPDNRQGLGMKSGDLAVAVEPSRNGRPENPKDEPGRKYIDRVQPGVSCLPCCAVEHGENDDDADPVSSQGAHARLPSVFLRRCPENRAGFRKRDMNLAKNKVWDS
jgi:hypothetical protein